MHGLDQCKSIDDAYIFKSHMLEITISNNNQSNSFSGYMNICLDTSANALCFRSVERESRSPPLTVSISHGFNVFN